MKKRPKIRPSGDPASHGGSGEKSYAAEAAAPHRKGGDEGNERKHQQKEGGDVSPTHREGIVVRPKRRRRKEKHPLSEPGPVQRLCGKSVVVGKQQQHKSSCRSSNVSLSTSRSGVWQEVGDASADPPIARKKKGKRVIQHTKSSPSDPTGKSNVGSGEVWKTKQQPQPLKHSIAGDAQAAGGNSAAPPSKEESVDHVPLCEREPSPVPKLLMDQNSSHASHSSLQSVEVREQASFGEQKTSIWLKAEKEQPMPSSSGDEDLGKNAQDEDEQSDKKPFSKDVCEIIASNEDEQRSNKIGVEVIASNEDEHHSDKIGVEVIASNEDECRSTRNLFGSIQDHKEEQGGAGRHIQSILDMDNDTLSKQIAYYFDLLKYDPPDNSDNWFEYTPQQLTELYQRLAFYRIRGYELSVDRQLPQLDDTYLEERCSSDYLLSRGYFKCYEEDLEWYFDPELCRNAYYNDYQRLTLYDYGEYQDWDEYHLIRNTYEQDLAYVKYCEEIANETEWVDDFLVNRSIPWEKIENVALLQALKVQASVHNVPLSLLSSGLREHLWSIQFDHFNYRGMDSVYFEIWKRVSKQNMNFTNALSEIHRENIFPLLSLEIECELKGKIHSFSIKDNYDAHVACIDETVLEVRAELLIKEAVIKMCPKPKNYVDYASKKLSMAKDIGLVDKGATLGVRPQCRGHNGEAKLAMDS